MMRFVTRLEAAALAASALTLLVAGGAQAQSMGFGGHAGGLQGIGVGAFQTQGGVPVAGPTGTRGFWGGNFSGRQKAFGFFGGWGGGYGYGGGAPSSAPGGGATVNNYVMPQPEPRRYDGGFYGGAGVFYPDDGYSRDNAVRRPSAGYRGGYGGAPDYIPAPVYPPAQHIIYLSTTDDRTPARADRRARAHRRHGSQN